jgi:predicted AlkP superfamily pyrophosphatase or phosphodiesterase
MEIQTVWITINAKSKAEVKKILSKSPFNKYWKFNIHELIIWDGQNYRLPVVQLN